MKIASIKDDVLYVDELIEGGATSFSENGLITGELIEYDEGVSFTEGNVYVKELVEDDMPPIQDGLVLWYDFKDRKNTDYNRSIAIDKSGNGNHGTLNNFAYTEESGYKDDGLVFDGVDDYVGLPNAATPVIPFTVEMVFSKSDFNTFGSIFSNFNAAYGGWRFIPASNGSGRSTFLLRNGGVNTTINFDTGILTDVLYYVSLSVTPEGVYLTVNDVDYQDLQPIEISGGYASDHLFRERNNAVYTEGTLKSARIYSRALTPAEIQTNYLIDKQRFNLP